MSGFFEGLYAPLWKKFGDHEIKISAITAVWFHQRGFVNQEEKHPCVTIYFDSNQVILTGEELDEFKSWWQQEKENCGIDENS